MIEILLYIVYTRGRMSTNSILFIIIFALLAICLFFIIQVSFRLRKLFKGSKTETLEGLMNEIVSHVGYLKEKGEIHDNALETLSSRISKYGRGVKIMRFNPFKDVGGNQSFAVAIINEDGDGVVLSSLYSRERMSVFAKPIIKGESDIELSAEEKTVIDEAQKETRGHHKE